MQTRFHGSVLIALVAFTALPFAKGASEVESLPPSVELRDENGTKPWFVNSAQSRKMAAGQRTAAASNWTSLGPFGGDVSSVAVSPTNSTLVLAGLAPSNAAGSLFRSIDGGNHWQRVEGFEYVRVYDIEFNSDGIAYVGSEQGVWRSTDDGVTWTQLQLGAVTSTSVYEVSIDPNTPATVWVGVATNSVQQTPTVFRSTDGGDTWVDRTPPMGPLSCFGIAINRGDSDRVYACFTGFPGGGAIWVSSDAGQSWVERSIGLPNSLMSDVIHDGSRLLVCGGQPFASETFGLYASDDEGETWVPLHNGWPNLYITDIAQDPLNPETILVASRGDGVFKSTNNGVDWTYGIGGTGGYSINSVHFVPGSASRILVGLESFGVWESLDGGSSFNAINSGIAGLNTMSIAANPLNPVEYAVSFQASNSGGVYTSMDAGQTWELESLPATRYNDVVFSPSGVLYAISDGPSTVAPEGVYRRNQDGTWTGLGPDQGPLYETDLYCLAFSRNNNDLILAGGADWVTDLGTMWISIDAGNTWTKAYEGAPYIWILDIAWVEDGMDMTCLAAFGGNTEGGALRSIDGGFTWVNSSAGLPSNATGNALSSPPGQPQTFYYADNRNSGGLYKTTNAGMTWTSTGDLTPGPVSDVLCDLGDSKKVYISRWPELVLVSIDGASHFDSFATGLDPTAFPRSLGYAEGPMPRLLMASGRGTYAQDVATAITLEEFSGVPSSQGVWLRWRLAMDTVATLERVIIQRALDERGPWSDLADLKPRPTMDFEDTDSSAGRTYWYRLLFVSTDSTRPSNALRVATHASSWKTVLYPPLQNAEGVVIRYALAQAGQPRIDILDVRGRRMEVLDQGSRQPGEYVVMWDRIGRKARVARGLYVVRLQVGPETAARKLVLR